MIVHVQYIQRTIEECASFPMSHESDANATQDAGGGMKIAKNNWHENMFNNVSLHHCWLCLPGHAVQVPPEGLIAPVAAHEHNLFEPPHAPEKRTRNRGISTPKRGRGAIHRGELHGASLASPGHWCLPRSGVVWKL